LFPLANPPVSKNTAFTDAFIFEGAAGRYSLRRIRTEKGNLRLMDSIRVPPDRSIIHSGPKNQFLKLTSDRISLWNPSNNIVKILPVRSGNFTLFNEGLLYEGIDRSLYLRNTLYTDIEFEIMETEEKLRSELKKLTEEKEENNAK
jgi:hypothetical protein